MQRSAPDSKAAMTGAQPVAFYHNNLEQRVGLTSNTPVAPRPPLSAALSHLSALLSQSECDFELDFSQVAVNSDF